MDIPLLVSAPCENKPRVAILREQGVNGHVEMAWAFHAAGFTVLDIHMSDLIAGRGLDDVRGLVFAGGFSYGDVLGAGVGWGKGILMNPKVREVVLAFFERGDTFVLGVCNGCQMLSTLAALVPGLDNGDGGSKWPRVERNISSAFEARTVLCKVMPSPCIFLKGMDKSIAPIAVAHGEGRIDLDEKYMELACMQYVLPSGEPAQTGDYPANPNGSGKGVAGVTSPCGRFMGIMPHPERVVRQVGNTWRTGWEDEEWGSWMKMFWNVREWCG
jgi:phosphoribosylformylglycinamidine synthase